ncbi:unnamed protein product [Prorocentrum cordatum]|uniref:ATP-dependent DNA helicase n=1 Tax=Prorocentrum cordatum TaxID=2364126 RepID=A0ABN9VTY9_9DINO|nr:unnamed protein product [Polarella glacialis]
MGPRRCSGFATDDGIVIECCFNPWEKGKRAQGKFEGKCQWCSPIRMATICATPQQSKLTAHSLANLHKLDIGIYDMAVERVKMHERGDQLIARAVGIISERSQVGVPPPPPIEGDQGSVVSQPAEEEIPAAMEPDEEAAAAGPAAAAEPPPVPAEGEGAAAGRRRQRLCEGYSLARAMGRRLRSKEDEGVCLFSREHPGQRAMALDGKCLWCTPARMKEAASNPAKKRNAMTDLKKHLTPQEYKVIVTPKDCCRGAGEAMCPFSTANPGQPARVVKADKHLCSWCDPQRLRGMQTEKRRGVLKQLEAFHEKDEAVFAKAEAILKDVFGDNYVAQMKKKTVRQNQQAAKARRRTGETDWPTKLAKRRLAMESPTVDEEARKKFRKLTLADLKKVENSFYKDTAERKMRGRADEVPKSKDLEPPIGEAGFSDLSKGLRSWAAKGSRGICKECHVLQPRPMHEIDMFLDASEEISKSACRRCNASREMYVPLPDDAPGPLRGLSEEIVEALRPIEIDVGPETRSTDTFGRPNGYRKKVKMITFYFSKWHVKDKIKELDDDAWRTAKKAYKYLLSCEESSYKRFHDMHEKFLRKQGEDAADRKRKRPYHFLQEVGLECALWPNLYWCTEMTETHEQWSDARREERRDAQEAKKKKAKHGYDSDAEDDEGGDGGGHRTSVKRSFMTKCLSPLLGYGSNSELLQFVYDLNLWATLGAKKNLGLDNVPMRMLMKGHTFSPLYWKEVHNALVDLVRQVGFPTLFFTIAPWEPCFKYHDWLRDEMEKTLRTRMHLPVGETLHMSHVLMQIVRGMLAGNNYQMMDRSSRSWTKHVLSAKDADGRQVRVQSFTRLEFQDGSRKEGTKRYDGSGRPHLHVLFFADDDSMANMGLEQHLFATQPDGFSDDLQGYVDGSQFNKHGDAESKWPIYHGPSGVHGDDGVLQLKHTEEDHDAGLRAYCADVMDGLPCHQDWQTSDGEAMLLQYVSKYVAKFSDSSYDEWMSDKASADSVARRVCFEYHPYEPEMILQLCGAQFRQYDISTVSGGFRTVTAPYSGMAEVPEWVQRYAACSWRHEGMTLLDWLRKTTDDGAIAGWLKRKHKQELVLALHRRYRATVPDGEEPQALDAHWRFLRAEYKGMADADGGGSGNSDKDSDAEDEEQPKTFEEFLAKKHSDEKSEGEDDFPNLKEFARAYRMQGEKVVSVDTVYELNDRYYGQWAAMNVPFRSLDELEFEDVNRLVPQKYKYLAAALRLCSDQGRVAEEHHDLFTDDRRLVDYMSASAKSSKFTEAVHHMIVGQRKLINMYLTGIIDKADEKAAADAEAAVIANRRPARGEGQEEVDFNPKQLQLEEAINERVDRAVRAELSEDWEEADEAREEAYKKNTPVICLGKPGTGKTTVVKSCIRRAQEQGARVLFALPTAQLSSRMRAALQGLGGLTVDTCHAAFKLHDPITESLHRMTDFDLVVVDEVSLLSCESFERILKLWSVSGKVPALVFLGDKHQLPGVEPTRPWESAAWKRPRCFHVKLTETWRCKEERFQEILDELRTDKPSKETFRKIVRDHKAWKSRGDPTPAEMKKLFEKHPDTRIVTCTRRGAAAVNEAAVAALYGRKTPLATLDGDVELNPENYVDGKLRTDRRLVPSRVPIYKGMQLYLTKNKNKEADEVNGMLCEVENYHAEEDMLRVMTKTGHLLAITRWTDREKGNAVYFPIRLGHASTIDKVQGDEFPHITIYLDGWPRPAAGYAALSRVATSDDYLIGGYVERDNFIPAF